MGATEPPRAQVGGGARGRLARLRPRHLRGAFGLDRGFQRPAGAAPAAQCRSGAVPRARRDRRQAGGAHLDRAPARLRGLPAARPPGPAVHGDRRGSGHHRLGLLGGVLQPRHAGLVQRPRPDRARRGLDRRGILPAGTPAGDPRRHSRHRAGPQPRGAPAMGRTGKVQPDDGGAGRAAEPQRGLCLRWVGPGHCPLEPELRPRPRPRPGGRARKGAAGRAGGSRQRIGRPHARDRQAGRRAERISLCRPLRRAARARPHRAYPASGGRVPVPRRPEGRPSRSPSR